MVLRQADRMANRPGGFEYKVVGKEVFITHHGRRATTLRAATADQFLADAQSGDPQELMARVTGNYKHGNERTAKTTHATAAAETTETRSPP